MLKNHFLFITLFLSISFHFTIADSSVNAWHDESGMADGSVKEPEEPEEPAVIAPSDAAPADGEGAATDSPVDPNAEDPADEGSAGDSGGTDDATGGAGSDSNGGGDAGNTSDDDSKKLKELEKRVAKLEGTIVTIYQKLTDAAGGNQTSGGKGKAGNPAHGWREEEIDKTSCGHHDVDHYNCLASFIHGFTINRYIIILLTLCFTILLIFFLSAVHYCQQGPLLKDTLKLKELESWN